MMKSPARASIPALGPTLAKRADPAQESFRIADYPFYRIARVEGLYTACLEQELKPRGMSQPHWRVLMILSEHNPSSMGLIAEMAVMKLPTLLKLVRRMTDEGLVSQAPRQSDQRVTEVSITPAGRRALRTIKRSASQVYHGAFAKLSASDLERLNRLLGKIEVNLQAARIHGGNVNSSAG